MQKILRLTLLLFFIANMVGIAQINPPTNLTASLSGSNHHFKINLAWQYGQVQNVKFYVYKKLGAIADTGTFRKIGTSYQKNFYDMNVNTGLKYSYYVTAVVGNVESEASNKVEITVTAPVVTYGKIVGFLKDDSTNAPVIRGTVQIFSSNPAPGSTSTTVKTDSFGFFSAKVKTGTYYIYSSAMSYFGEYYDNVPTKNLATSVTVNANDSLIFNIGLKRFVPPPPPVMYSVTGLVKDVNNLPLKSDITAYVTNRGNIHPSCNHKYFTRSDSTGNFQLNIKSGDTLVIYCSPKSALLKSEYWDNKATFELADRVAVYGNVTGINFVIEAKPVYNNGISGFVKDSAGVLPLKASVFAYKKNVNGYPGWKSSVKTDTLTGDYTFTNLEPGKYILLASARGFKPTYFKYNGQPTMNWREADSVVVSETGVISGINFNLRMFHHTGSNSYVYGIINEQNGNLINGSLTYVLDYSNQIVGFAVSDLDGTYSINGLADGNYTLVSNTVSYQDAQISNIIVDGESVQEVNLLLNPDGVTGIENNSLTVTQYELSQNYPNPFNPSTTISYSLPTDGFVSLTIYNAIGQKVASLINGIVKAGSHQVTFNASTLSTGIYFYRLEAGNFVSTKKMILIK
jgi:hypothetical protein